MNTQWLQLNRADVKGYQFWMLLINYLHICWSYESEMDFKF